MKGVVFTLIRGFFGDNINRAVSDTVNAAVSPANVAVYCKVFKDSMWFVKLNQTNRKPPKKKNKTQKKHQSLSHFGILVIPGGLLHRALSALGAAASMLHHSAVYADVRTPIC